ncbi:hypothetical protein O3M35_007107 [Rhynocoris fuscipes]|uniref:Farnesol dehydrogenase n=1 Tax=Rhynocoris fuscipes TaxID=488301 RepID=A0AAW1D856_9HEMI
MDRWIGRVAVVTGASAGIGETIASELARYGMKVAALARRLDKLQKLKESCKDFKGSLEIYKCDVTKEDEIANTFKAIVNELGPISVLVNNAGVLKAITLTDIDQESARCIYETNIIGLVTCTQHAISIMKKHRINDGHIIHINSITGHNVLPSTGTGHYCATKHAVTSLTESLKNELSALNMETRVTSISPGLVKTYMADTLIDYYKHEMPTISTKDVSHCVVFALSMPPNVNVTELTVQPVKETISSFM